THPNLAKKVLISILVENELSMIMQFVVRAKGRGLHRGYRAAPVLALNLVKTVVGVYNGCVRLIPNLRHNIGPRREYAVEHTKIEGNSDRYPLVGCRLGERSRNQKQ